MAQKVHVSSPVSCLFIDSSRNMYSSQNSLQTSVCMIYMLRMAVLIANSWVVLLCFQCLLCYKEKRRECDQTIILGNIPIRKAPNTLAD